MTFPNTAHKLRLFIDETINQNQTICNMKADISHLKDKFHELGLFMENMQKEMRAGFDAILHLFQDMNTVKGKVDQLELLNDLVAVQGASLKNHIGNSKIHIPESSK